MSQHHRSPSRRPPARPPLAGPALEEAVHLYNEGVTLQDQGKITLAESAFRRALSINPEFAEAHHNLGKLLLEQKKWKVAEKSFRRALQLLPDDATLLGSIGKALHRQGKTAAALETLQQALRLDPRSAMAIHTLGTVLLETGKVAEAVEQLKQAHDLLPGSPEIATCLGGALVRLEYFEEAVDILHNTVKTHPRYFDAYPLLADAAYEIGAIDDAIKILHEAAKLKPEDDRVHARLAEIHLARGDYLETRSAITRAIRINAKTADYFILLGRALRKLNLNEDAERNFRKAINLEPRNSSHHCRLGWALLARGERDNAEKSLRHALKLQPDNAYAWRGLAQARKILEPGDTTRIQALLQNPDLPDKEKIVLYFVLGTLFDSQGEYETAYAHISKGNALNTANSTHEVDSLVQAMNLTAVLTGDLVKKHDKAGYGDSTPVFVTGLSRSGKTVLETLLARHSRVTAGGESSDFFKAIDATLGSRTMASFPECIVDLPARVFANIGRKYTALLQQRYPGKICVTNTSPGNTWYIGMIRLCLPNAKFIVCQRDARDNCTEIFNKDLGPDHQYSFDMNAVGAYYQRHSDLVEHWCKLLPGFIHIVQFEELLRDPQTQISTVLDFCGLPVEEACLDTTSLPAPDAVIGVWKHYREPLKLLYEMLETT